MTSREAFKHAYESLSTHPDDFMFSIWQAACEWQKQKDALIADSFYQEIRQYTTDVPNISSAILNQGDE